jgi:hypothetical protein
VFLYNKKTGETKWESPDRSQTSPPQGRGAEGGAEGGADGLGLELRSMELRSMDLSRQHDANEEDGDELDSGRTSDSGDEGALLSPKTHREKRYAGGGGAGGGGGGGRRGSARARGRPDRLPHSQ